MSKFLSLFFILFQFEPSWAHQAKIYVHIPELVLNHGHTYKTVNLQLSGASDYFRHGQRLLIQEWNRNYSHAQDIFAETHRGSAKRAFIHLEHRKLYHTNSFTKIEEVSTGQDLLALIDSVKNHGRFTYVLMEDGSFRFSSTKSHGPIDLLSKHAIHSDCAESVLYAGEFCITENQDGTKILLINNNSGTYAPRNDQLQLQRLRRLLTDYFPHLKVVTQEFHDPWTHWNLRNCFQK